MQLDFGLFRAARVGEKVGGVERRVAREFPHCAVKFIRPAARGNRDRSAAVASFFRRRIIGRDFIFLNVVGVDAIKIRHRIGHGGFVRLDAVNRHVEGAVARTVDRNA